MKDAQLQGKGLLIVDDEEEIRKFLEFQFRRKGMNVVTAAHGQEATRILSENPNAFQVIISDLRMPEMNGLQVLEFVRAHAQLKHIPFIILTGEADQQIVVQALKTGIDDILLKPMEFATLVEKVKTVLIPRKT